MRAARVDGLTAASESDESAEAGASFVEALLPLAIPRSIVEEGARLPISMFMSAFGRRLERVQRFSGTN